MTSLRNRSESTTKASTDVESDVSEKAVESDDSSIPPDGGFHGWLIVLASFLTNGLVFGIHNCYSIIYLRLKNELELSGITDAATKACKFLNLCLFIIQIVVHILILSFNQVSYNYFFIIIKISKCSNVVVQAILHGSLFAKSAKFSYSSVQQENMSYAKLASLIYY